MSKLSLLSDSETLVPAMVIQYLRTSVSVVAGAHKGVGNE